MVVFASPRKTARTQGVALIVTLFFLLIITVLVVGFAASMRTERAASHAAWTNEQTKLLVDTAMAHATSLLANNIPSPAAPANSSTTAAQLEEPLTGQYISLAHNAAVNWTVNPGRLTIIDRNSTTPHAVGIPGTQWFSHAIDLHTGAATSNSDVESVDLNVKALGSDEYTIAAPPANGSAPMRVKWIPVMQDASASASAANPIIGRYAFWMDDECARINFNTAAGKSSDIAQQLVPKAANDSDHNGSSLTPTFKKNFSATSYLTYALGHPASINLDLLGSIQPALYSDIYTKGFFHTPDAIRNDNYITNSDTIYKANKFYLTAFSRAPEFNVFGRSRIFPTGTIKVDLSNGPYYQTQSDLTQPMNFWGPRSYATQYNSLGNEGKINACNRVVLQPIIDNLSAYLRRDDWPGMPAMSFSSKWASEPSGPYVTTGFNNIIAAGAEVDQVAMNVMAMGAFGSATMTTSGEDTSFITRAAEFCHFGSLDSSTAASPDRYVWFSSSGQPMLPQLPCPHINEIEMVITPEYATVDPDTQKPLTTPVYFLKYFFRVEVYDPSEWNPVDTAKSTSNGAIPPVYTNVALYALKSGYLSYSTSGGGTATTQTFKVDDTTGSGNGWSGSACGNIGWAPPTTSSAPPPPFVPNQWTEVQTSPYYLGSYKINGVDGAISLDAKKVAGKYRTKFTPGQTVSVDAYFRIGAATGRPGDNGSYQNFPMEIVPIFTPSSGGTSGSMPDTRMVKDQAKGGALHFAVSITLAADGSSILPIAQDQEATDPRVNTMVENWKPRLAGEPGPGTDTIGFQNSTVTSDTLTSKNRYWNVNRTDATLPSLKVTTPSAAVSSTGQDTAVRTTATGMFSLVPTGMKRNLPWHSINLKPAGTSLPEYLILDLLGPCFLPSSYVVSSSTEVTPDSYMNSTAGKININTKIYPANAYFAPPARTLPLQALFHNMFNNTPDELRVVQNIVDYQGTGRFDYVGQVCEVAKVYDGTATDEYQGEQLVRHLASCMTTQSNTFGVYGVTQSVRKAKGKTTNYGQYETGDTILGEKRFYAVIERYVWPGRDGVPGNGHVGSDGKYDRLAKGLAIPNKTSVPTYPGGPPDPLALTDPSTGTTYAFAAIDGPDNPIYPGNAMASYPTNPSASNDPLDKADNPARALMKYRVVYFKYLTD